MWMPGKADEITWKALWRAVEAETRDITDLKSGSDAFYTAVGERFTEIIDRTQVVDTVLKPLRCDAEWRYGASDRHDVYGRANT